MSHKGKIIKIEKIVVNIGAGEGAQDKKIIEEMMGDLSLITGQKPKINKSRFSIAEFKLRKGAPVGLMVTLRGQRMTAFLTKLIKIVIPRLRDFQGLSLKSFDGRGNYSLGIPEQVIFPEIDATKATKTKGLQITIKTNAGSDDLAQELLTKLGMPFTK